MFVKWIAPHSLENIKITYEVSNVTRNSTKFVIHHDDAAVNDGSLEYCIENESVLLPCENITLVCIYAVTSAGTSNGSCVNLTDTEEGCPVMTGEGQSCQKSVE